MTFAILGQNWCAIFPQALLDLGADPILVNKKGYTSLMCAAEGGNEKVYHLAGRWLA